MQRPSILRVVLKDCIDFVIVILIMSLLTLGIYYLLPNFKPVDLSLYFFEQFFEIFLVNPPLFVWFLGLGFGVSVVYFLFCTMLFGTTMGGLMSGVIIVDRKSMKPLATYQAIFLAIGAYVGILAFFVGPLSGWWLNADHRGWSEKFSGTITAKKGS